MVTRSLVPALWRAECLILALVSACATPSEGDGPHESISPGSNRSSDTASSPHEDASTASAPPEVSPTNRGVRSGLQSPVRSGDGRDALDDALRSISPRTPVTEATRRALLRALRYERISPVSPDRTLDREETRRIRRAIQSFLEVARDTTKVASCIRWTTSAIQLAQDATRGYGVSGYQLYARLGGRALDVLRTCLSGASDARRARAASRVRMLIASAPPPTLVVRATWRAQLAHPQRSPASLSCRWNAEPPSSKAARARISEDMVGWQRQHLASLRNSASLAQDEQIEYLEVLFATDPVPCLRPEPVVWRIKQGLSLQYELWQLCESLVEHNPEARVELRDEIYNRQTRQVMERVLDRDDNAIDVGAFRGEILQEMVDVAPSGHHLAFEPLPDRHRALATRFASETVTVHAYALGATRRTTTFERVVDDPGHSGLNGEFETEDRRTESFEVKVRPLDDVLDSTYTVDLIKIDVEGATPNVIEGARDTICAQTPVVLFEFGGPEIEAVWHDLHEACGLELYTLHGWLAGESPLTSSQFTSQVERDAEFYFLAVPDSIARGTP